MRNILSFLQSDTGDGKSTPAYSILNFCHGVDLKKVNLTQLNVKWKLDVKVMATAAHITHSLKLLKYCTHGEYNLAHLTVFSPLILSKASFLQICWYVSFEICAYGNQAFAF